MKNRIFIVNIVLVTLVGFFVMGCSSNYSSELPTAENTAQDNQVLKISASISNRSYTPKQIDVPLGSTVELTVQNNDNEQHGLTIQDFGVREFVGPNSSKTVRFVADQQIQASTFCSVAHPEKLIINVI